ncbi:MAG: hypothetical protein NVSMB68_08870 [Thermoanaerobaculia bacterium]
MRPLVAAAFIVILTLISASPLAAQNASGLQFGVAVGESTPTGDAKHDFKNGGRVTALVATGTPGSTVGLRFEASYDELKFKTSSDFPDFSGKAKILSGTANAVISPFHMQTLVPYLIGGGGVYDFKTSTTSMLGSRSQSENKFGWNAGGGIAFGVGRTHLFVEGRYHSISTSGQRFTYIPVSVGIVF